MKHYSDEFKAALVEKRLPPQHVPVGALARETGIPKDTLYTWRLKARRASGVSAVAHDPSPERWSAEAKFAVVLETAALSEAELSAYCRRKGLYAEGELRPGSRRASERTGRRRPRAKSKRSVRRRRDGFKSSKPSGGARTQP
jgi:transposase-like protein